MRVAKRRKRQRKTDYKARIELLKSEAPRIAIRKTNRYIIIQYIISKEAKDKTLIYANSRELLKLGWLKEWKNSLKSIPASYLTGFLAGKKILNKEKQIAGEKQPILDFGLQREIKGSRIYATVKGLIDAGVKIKIDEKIFPKQERLKGMHMKKDVEKILNEIKNKIEKEI